MARITDNYLKRVEPETNKKILSIRLETNLYAQIKRTAKNTITRSFVFRSVLADGKSYTEYLGSVNDLTIADARKLAQERRDLLKQCGVPREYIKNEIEKKISQQLQESETVQTALELFLSKRKNLSKNTHIHDQTIINFIQPFLSVRLSSLDDCRVPFDLIYDCINKGLISKARSVAIFIIQMIETAIDYKLISHNPFTRLTRLIPVKDIRHFTSVSPDNIERDLIAIFTETFKSKRIKKSGLFLLVGIYTLLRPAEAAMLKKSNWNQEKQTLFVEKTKTRKDGWLIQTNEYLDKLLSYCAKQNIYDRFFDSSANGSLNAFFRYHKIKFTAHGWRSAGMSWLVQNGYPIYVAKAILTHRIADTVTTAYMRSNLPKERKEALRQWNIFISEILKNHNPEIYTKIFQNC